MTRQEFIQEAALRLISANPDISMVEVADSAKQLADEIFPEEEQPQEEQQTFTPAESCASHPISTLIREVDRIDEEEKKRKQKESNRKWGRGYKYNKLGYGRRLQSACSRYDIATVGQLLEAGREEFKRYHFVGIGLVETIDQALKNLYGITEW